MALVYVIKAEFSNHQIIVFTSLCRATTLIRIKTATKVEETWVNWSNISVLPLIFSLHGLY